MRAALTRGAALGGLLLLAECGGRSEPSWLDSETTTGGVATLPVAGRASAGGSRAAGGSANAGAGEAAWGGEPDTGGTESAGGAALEPCPAPIAPVLDVIDRAETLRFTVEGDGPIQIAVLDGANFTDAAELALAPFTGPTRVRARTLRGDCTPSLVFDAVYDVRDGCPGAPGRTDSNAIAASDPRIVDWANGVHSYLSGGGMIPGNYQNPQAALGPATAGKSVVTLGDGGVVTLSFEPAIVDNDGYDLAVFENGFNDGFLELAFVEVSSDGETYARFDSAFRGDGPASTGYTGDPGRICSLAGNFRQLFGAPFDLRALANQPLVRAGTVDLNAIAYVRIVDIVGDGQTLDSFGRGIFDPHPTPGAAGFDLDAIAVLHSGARIAR